MRKTGVAQLPENIGAFVGLLKRGSELCTEFGMRPSAPGRAVVLPNAIGGSPQLPCRLTGFVGFRKGAAEHNDGERKKSGPLEKIAGRHGRPLLQRQCRGNRPI